MKTIITMKHNQRKTRKLSFDSIFVEIDGILAEIFEYL